MPYKEEATTISIRRSTKEKLYEAIQNSNKAVTGWDDFLLYIEQQMVQGKI